MPPHEHSRRIRQAEAAKYIGLAESTLEKDRSYGRLKIPYLKMGKAVLYDTAALDAWMAARQRFSTREIAA